jgi:predicted nucleic acid-binding protein
VTLVLDAGAALALVIARPERLSVAAILQHPDWVLAPSLFVYEVANTLSKYHRLLGIKWKELQDRYRQTIALADELIPAGDLHVEALRLACQLGCPADDAFYLAAAHRRKAAILSLDRRIIHAAARLGIPVAESWLRP